jgi:hypothetical protein
MLSSLTGCGEFGANAMRQSRTDYNMALQRSNEEQLLANLVRLRYVQSPSFLEIEGITTQLSLDAEAEAGFEHERVDDADLSTTKLFSFGGSVGFSSSPTITFTPLRGKEFLEQFLAPIEIEKIILLYNSGWTLKRILRLTVQSINGIPNAKRAGGPTPENMPHFERFAEVIDLMRKLERLNLLEFTFEPYTERTGIALVFRPSAWNTSEAKRLAKLLNINPGEEHYDVIYRSIRDKKEKLKSSIILETRSLLGVLFFLSQNVKVPQEDIDKGVVGLTLTANALPFDWSKVLQNSFIVKSMATLPPSPVVAVFYRGSWFYIEDNDLESKATLMLVSQLFALQSGQGKALSPILTLPVGR